MCQQREMEFGTAKCFLRELFDKWKERDSDFFFTELSTTVHLRARKAAGNKKGGEKRSLECSQNNLQLKQGARAL